ncbi:MAG TPA: hypothetical protein VGB63_02340 [Pedobacter sp.]|jgi:hypothetical protein
MDNNIFSIKRFWMLFKKHTIENLKFYAMATVVMTGILVVWLGFNTLMMKRPIPVEMQWYFYWACLLGFGTIFISTLFEAFGNRKKSIITLVLPASHLEKFFVGWTYAVIVLPLVYTACYYLADVFTLSLKPGNAELFNVFSDPRNSFLCRVYLLLNSIALLGSIYFEKLHFIKIAFAFFIVIVLILAINNQVIKSLIPSVIEDAPFFKTRIREGEGTLEIALTKSSQNIYDWLVYGLCIPFWIAAYYKIKEKQV